MTSFGQEQIYKDQPFVDHNIYDYETKGLIIRSRARWLEEGEKSSKYFCNLENRLWKKKSINRIKDNNGNLILDQTSILNEIHDFYCNLYSNQDGDQTLHDVARDTFFNSLDIPKLNDDEKNALEEPLSKPELFDVIRSIKTNKTPGYDGLPIEFYIVFWPDVCDMLIDSYNFSLQNGLMSLSQRNGVITLIPKKDKDPLCIKNYRPITLLTVDYKILAKCLANVIHN